MGGLGTWGWEGAHQVGGCWDLQAASMGAATLDRPAPTDSMLTDSTPTDAPPGRHD